MALRPQQVAPELLHKVTKALGITALDQWYYVSQHTAAKAIGSSVLNKVGGTVADFLKYAYPKHHFDEEKLSSKITYEKDQKFLEVIIRQLFPNTEIHTKARKSVGIINPETGVHLEIDFWMPSLKLGIEYQDKHHFGYQWYANDTLEDYQKRDDIKKVGMATMGYTLITIGYWWDKSIESLAATIRKHRPDLLRDYEDFPASSIPSDPPLLTAAPVIPGIVGLMNPFIPINDFNPTNWYGGEKHDGIRGVYNPELRTIFSRAGSALSVLPSLMNDIPQMLVEGEIVAGRGNYNKTAGVSFHMHHDKVNWPMFRYVVFDIPNSALGNYTDRYTSIMNELLSHTFIFAQSAFRVLLDSKEHLKLLVDTIISDAGEGMIAQRDTRYEYGRSKALAKIKVRRDDDAQVLSINQFSCTCKLVNGTTTDISFCDNFNPSNLKTGDIVSYYHHGYSLSGLPKRGEIYKIRYDMEELVGEEGQNFSKRRSLKDAIGSKSLTARNTHKMERGYWNKAPNLLAFFEKLARKADFDPLVAENWYPVRYSELRSAGGIGIFSAYGSLNNALSYAYPGLDFEAKQFITHQTKVKDRHWTKSPNVRAFFDGYARKAGFDPLVTENWYLVRISALEKAGAYGLLGAHSRNMTKALSYAYPELSFDEQMFVTYQTKVSKHSKGYWKKPYNVRAFLDEFARTSGFDPLVPENWYSCGVSALCNAGGLGMLKAYGLLLQNVLSCGYPELKFEEANFIVRQKVRNGHWERAPNVRVFFDKFAKTSGFDPLVPTNWHPITLRTLKGAGGYGLLKYFHCNKMKALSYAYPELNFSKKNFKTGRKVRPKLHTMETSTRSEE